MKKIVSLLGLLVTLSLGAIAWLGLPATDVMAGPAVATACAASEVALDEGYGVTRVVQTPCAQR